MAEQGQIIKDEKYESIFAYESKTAQIIASKAMDSRNFLLDDTHTHSFYSIFAKIIKV